MDTIKQQTNEKLLNMITSLTYCMMDVLHTMLMDCEKYMKVCGRGMHHEEKKKWNEFFRAQQRVKFCAKQITHVCYKELPTETSTQFASDSDFLCDLLYLVIDRCGEDPEIMTKLRALIYNSFKTKKILPDNTSFYDNFA